MRCIDRQILMTCTLDDWLTDKQWYCSVDQLSLKKVNMSHCLLVSDDAMRHSFIHSPTDSDIDDQRHMPVTTTSTTWGSWCWHYISSKHTSWSHYHDEMRRMSSSTTYDSDISSNELFGGCCSLLLTSFSHMTDLCDDRPTVLLRSSQPHVVTLSHTLSDDPFRRSLHYYCTTLLRTSLG